jgi:hypothetical protein
MIYLTDLSYTEEKKKRRRLFQNEITKYILKN